jgi:hypothetical protein
MNQDLCDKLWRSVDLGGKIIFVKQLMFSNATFMSYATSKRKQVFRDIYNYEMNHSFISSSTFADSLQKVFKASTLNLITFITPS